MNVTEIYEKEREGDGETTLMLSSVVGILLCCRCLFPVRGGWGNMRRVVLSSEQGHVSP